MPNMDIQAEKQSEASALQELALQVLRESRRELTIRLRYLTIALGTLALTTNPDEPSFSTDGRTLFANPRAVTSMYMEDSRRVTRLFLHEVLHCLLLHPFNAPPASTPESELRTQLWDLSCDMAVEFLIDDLDLPCTRLPRSRLRSDVRAELSEAMRVLTAEGIFARLSSRTPAPAALVQLIEEFSPDTHDRWPSHRTDPNAAAQAVQLKNSWSEIAEHQTMQMDAQSTETGSGDASVLAAAAAAVRRPMDYRHFLRRFACPREEPGVDPDAFDLSFYCLGLSMYGRMPLIEPLEAREVVRIDEFVIVIDVSMSVSGELVRSFLDQTASVLLQTETYTRRVNIRILQCDDRVRSDRKITSRKELEQYIEDFPLVNGGGTDFRPAFQYVAKLLAEKQFRHLRGLLYFTDGCGTWPAVRPPYETAFIFVESRYRDTGIPPWAIRVVLRDDQLAIG